MKRSVTVGAQLLWGGRYGCNNSRYGCTIVMSYIEINKAVPQWLLTFNLCVSVTWPLTCAFHIPCAHTPEIIDMHRGVCDNSFAYDRFNWHDRIRYSYMPFCAKSASISMVNFLAILLRRNNIFSKKFKVELKFICAEFQIFSTLSKHDITILVIISYGNRSLTSYVKSCGSSDYWV